MSAPTRALLAALLLLAVSARAQTPPAFTPPARTLVIGTKEAPPFAMKDRDGTWSGLSIDLWKQIADKLGLHSRFVERKLDALITDTKAGKLDGAIAAISVTAKREQIIDFSQPYFATGLGIAVPNRGNAGLWALVRAIFSAAFLQAILGLAALLLGVGALIWLVERRRNNQFDGGTLRGLGDGFWWSAVTMTTVGYGDKAPTTTLGRAIGVGWMFASVILISGVTAGITTALTTAQLQGQVRGPGDLSAVRVGSIDGTSSADYLDAQSIVYSGYDSVAAGLASVKEGAIDAFVYDKPMLLYRVQQSYKNDLRVLPATFDRQNYAIVLPQGSPMREPIDRTLLAIVQSDAWHQRVFSLLGNR